MAEMLRPADRPVLSLREAMDRLFEQSFTSPLWVRTWSNGNSGADIPVNIYEGSERYDILFAVPGAIAESIEVSVKQDTLTVSGELKPQVPDAMTAIWQEWQPTTFRRQIALSGPIEADNASVTYENGVLHIMLPKAEKVRTRTLKVQTAK